ncbi:MAG TPA: ribosomal protein S18-alanine N-acetyltransferase [Steroidobacteraceae bacterium]|nr:ribosomal protein S18-alanine N-acetyltransferase [Steroidobacteraceae bacterium]
MATALDETAPVRITHRRMSEPDLPAVIEIEAAAYMFPWSIGIFRDCLRVGYACRVLIAGDGIGGYGIMSMGAGEAHILNVCVRADLRGQGIGRRLLRWFLDEARSAGHGWAFLEVRPSNRPAIRLYESLGFAAVGLRRGYYQAVGGREDAVVYRLDLDTWGAAPERTVTSGRPDR